MKILNYGGTVQSLVVPDREGNPTDVLLGYNTVGGYEKTAAIWGTRRAFRQSNRAGGLTIKVSPQILI